MKAKKVVAIGGLATSGCGVALLIGRLSGSRWAGRVVGDHYHPIGPARGMRGRACFLRQDSGPLARYHGQPRPGGSRSRGPVARTAGPARRPDRGTATASPWGAGHGDPRSRARPRALGRRRGSGPYLRRGPLPGSAQGPQGNPVIAGDRGGTRARHRDDDEATPGSKLLGLATNRSWEESRL